MQNVRVGIRFWLIAYGYNIAFTICSVVLGVEEKFRDAPLDPTLEHVILATVFGPLIEETIYRLIPLWGIRKLTNSRVLLWATIFGSSVLFGYAHGEIHNIVTQGTIGFIFSIAFLRGGFIASSIAHALFNATSFAIALNLPS